MALNLSVMETRTFLKLCRNERLLYDTSHRDYRNREKRAAATRKISESLGIPNFGPLEVTLKLKNLRNSYSQELKKIDEDHNYHPKVHWFELMNSFLRPFIYSRATAASMVANLSVDGEVSKTGTWSDEDEEPWAAVHNSTEVSPWDVHRHLQVDLDESPSSVPVKRKRSSPSNDLTNNVKLVKLEDEHSQGPSVRDRPFSDAGEDMFDHFGRYIASLLREMGPPECYDLQQTFTSWILEKLRQKSRMQGERENKKSETERKK